MSKKAKFKVGDKVGRFGHTYKVAKVETAVTYHYLIEGGDGSRFWDDGHSMKAKAKKAGKSKKAKKTKG